MSRPNFALAPFGLCLTLMLASTLHATPEPDVAPDVGPTELETIQVTAAREEQTVAEATTSVSVIDQEELERRNARDLKDLVRYEPGVSVRNQPERFGLAGFSIRGLEANRVLVLLDGVRTADAFAIGSFSNATRNGIDIDALKQVEIVKGPASSLYGSSALGGIVALTTRDARDYTGGADGLYTAARLSLDGANDATSAGGTFALADGPWSVLTLINRQIANETENQGRNGARNSSRTLPNPQELESLGLLTKLGYRIGDLGELSLRFDLNDADVQTEVLSSIREQRFGSTQIITSAQTGDDRALRHTGAINFRSARPIGAFDRLELNLSRQASETTQRTVETRQSGRVGTPLTPLVVRRDFFFDQEQTALALTLGSRFTTGEVEHRLTYGLDYVDTRTEQLRDGSQTNLATGAVSTFVSPDDFPVRDFPISDTTEIAVFAQDEIGLLDGRLAFIPSIRYDRYTLDPRPDAIFAADNPGVATAPLEIEEISPKLGVRFEATPALSFYGHYAEGFRAPPYSDANIGFTNLQFGYTAIANPDLEPETSRGLELGALVRGELGFVRVAAYYNEYEDFIESLVSLGVDPQTGLLVFQSRNLTDVSIKGLEFRGALELGQLHPRLNGFSVDAAAAWARGEDHDVDQPLNSIDPLSGVLGLRYTTLEERSSVELVLSGARGQDRVDERFGPQFRPPGYGIVDLYVEHRLGQRMRLNLAVENLGDRFYWEWADVRGRAPTSPTLDRVTPPGRTVSAAFRIEF